MTNASKQHTITPRVARRIAVRADVDPRTVVARYRGARQSPAIVAAIDAAAEAEGVEPAPPPPEAA